MSDGDMQSNPNVGIQDGQSNPNVGIQDGETCTAGRRRHHGRLPVGRDLPDDARPRSTGHMQSFPGSASVHARSGDIIGRRTADGRHRAGAHGMPRMLMLDAPSLGLAPVVVQTMFEVIAGINKQGTTVLLVDSTLQHALTISSQPWVSEYGHIVLSGTGKEIMENEHTRRSYLGL
jgi:hypothetical protein